MTLNEWNAIVEPMQQINLQEKSKDSHQQNAKETN